MTEYEAFAALRARLESGMVGQKQVVQKPDYRLACERPYLARGGARSG